MTDSSNTKRVATDSSRDQSPGSKTQMVSRDRGPSSETLAERHPWVPLLAGFLGGCLPTIPNITPNFRSGTPIELSMFAQPLFAGIIGAIMVWVHTERNRRKAFFIGIAAPGLMLSADRTFQAATVPVDGAKQNSGPGASSSASPSWFHGLLPLAYAQDPVPPRPPRSVHIQVEGAPEPVRVDAIGPSEEKRQVFYGQHFTDAILPPGVERLEVAISGGGSATAELPVAPGPVVLQITVQQSFLSTLLAGIGLTGFAASQRILNVELEPTPGPVPPPLVDAGVPASAPLCAAGESRCQGAQRLRCNPAGTALELIEICGSPAQCTPQACN